MTTLRVLVSVGVGAISAIVVALYGGPPWAAEMTALLMFAIAYSEWKDIFWS